jgi:hypothetical protein
MKLQLLLLIIAAFTMQTTLAQIQPREAGQESSGENKKFDFRDNKSGTSMMPIMGDALPVIKYIEDTMKVEIVRLEYDLLFKDKSKYTRRYLFKDTRWSSYGIFAIGDYRIKKININVYVSRNNKWEFVSSTKSDTYTALAKVVPSEEVASEEYAFEIKADEFVEGYSAGHYAILIYH